MSSLMTRMRPSTSNAGRLRLPHRTHRRPVHVVLPAEADERLLSRSELDVLRATLVAGTARLR